MACLSSNHGKVVALQLIGLWLISTSQTGIHASCSVMKKIEKKNYVGSKCTLYLIIGRRKERVPARAA
eukprot:1158402-Pelagomonas_calceolata.AAC.2